MFCVFIDEKRLRSLEAAKLESEEFARKQAQLLEDEFIASKYEAKLKYKKDTPVKRTRKAKVVEPEVVVEKPPPLTYWELKEKQELAHEAEAKVAAAKEAERERQRKERTKIAMEEFNTLNANEITKDDIKDFISKHNLPLTKQEIKITRKMELFDRCLKLLQAMEASM